MTKEWRSVDKRGENSSKVAFSFLRAGAFWDSLLTVLEVQQLAIETSKWLKRNWRTNCILK
jgi:hypothetical protein